MSETPFENDNQPVEEAPAPGQRAASVRLRGDDADTDAAMMDPANQSLADALRITFVLVQGAMIVLAALFVFSGFQTVREGERGLSLLFGKELKRNLEPGFHFSAPYPFGELVKVGTGNESNNLLREFWPYTTPGREEDSIDRLPGRSVLDPQRDGSVITADLNLAHTQWQAVYRRTNPTEYVDNIYEDDEQEIVAAALRRGVVRTMASVGIDDLLKPQAGETRAISEQAQEIAQATLDAMNSGITIEQFQMGRKTPPVSLLGKFQAVLDARSNSQQAISQARTERDTTLNEAAGEAASGILWLISQYELMLELNDKAGEEAVLARIDAVLGGAPLRLTDEERALAFGVTGFPGLAQSDGKQASGAVVEVIENAKVERLTIVQEARADLELFKAKLSQFRANPSVMIHRDWASAWTSFQGNDFVQSMMLPVTDGTVELRINQDPDIVKDLDRASKQRDRKDAADLRMEELLKRQYQGERGTVVEDK